MCLSQASRLTSNASTHKRRDECAAVVRCFDLERSVVNDDVLSKAHVLMGPLMIRRVKKDAEKELPPKTETKISVPLSGVSPQSGRKSQLTAAVFRRDADLLVQTTAVQRVGYGRPCTSGSHR